MIHARSVQAFPCSIEGRELSISICEAIFRSIDTPYLNHGGFRASCAPPVPAAESAPKIMTCAVAAAAQVPVLTGTRGGYPRVARRPCMARALPSLTRFPQKSSCEVDEVCLDEYQLPRLGTLVVGTDPCSSLPGNGGLRVLQYRTLADARTDCRALTLAMKAKHAAFHTGFSGAKLVLHAVTEPARLDRRRLASEVAGVLNSLRGFVYTGCDLNTTAADMELLSRHTPYVLSSLTNRDVDSSVSTAHGVFGSILGVLEGRGGLARKRVLVKGIGKVGRPLTHLLLDAGAHVMTYDVNPAAADVSGCTNVSGTTWSRVACDVFAPCSVSRFIDVDLAKTLPCAVVVGASNVPFASREALEAATQRGVVVIPESVSSAGAVIGDSAELFSPTAYATARPDRVYRFVQDATQSKTRRLLREAAAHGKTPTDAVVDVMDDPSGIPYGFYFAKL